MHRCFLFRVVQYLSMFESTHCGAVKEAKIQNAGSSFITRLTRDENTTVYECMSVRARHNIQRGGLHAL